MTLLFHRRWIVSFSFLLHRVNKNCLPWAQKYFAEELEGVKVENNGAEAQITKVLEVDGDVELCQRKGKLITIFDVRIQLAWKGKKVGWMTVIQTNIGRGGTYFDADAVVFG